jgi:hypothetical protein
MKRQSKRATSDARRPAFVAARVSDRARHYLEQLSLLHRESLSSIIEIAIEELVDMPEDRYGAVVEDEFNKDLVYPTVTNVARETWSPEEWLRHLKVYLVVHALMQLPERNFWRDVCSQKEAYWVHGDPGSLSKETKQRLGPHVLKVGIPNESAIQVAWQAYRDSENQRRWVASDVELRSDGGSSAPELKHNAAPEIHAAAALGVAADCGPAITDATGR